MMSTAARASGSICRTPGPAIRFVRRRAVPTILVTSCAATQAQHVTVMFGCNLLALPVHAGGGGVINLDAVHADVALACFGIAGDHARQGDEASAILRPALQDGKIKQRKIFFLDDLFARAGGDDFGKELAHIGQHGQHL